MTQPPQKHILIDGYNVIRRTPALANAERKSLENGRSALLLQLRARYATAPFNITVVFDGSGLTETKEQQGCLQVIYTASGVSADQRMVELVAAARARKETAVVVTDDNEIRKAIHPHAPHATSHSAIDFGQSINAAPKLLQKQYKHRAAVKKLLQKDSDY